MVRHSGGLAAFSWLKICGGMAACAAVFAGLLYLSGPYSTALAMAPEVFVAGFAVAGFFALLLIGLARLVRPGPLAAGLWVTALALACLAMSFLPPVTFYGAASRSPRSGYTAFSVFSGGWYLLIMGIAMLSAARRDRGDRRPANPPAP